MAVYSVYAPVIETNPSARAERVILVRDGFSFTAFALTPLWLVRHGLWLRFGQWLLISALFAGILAIINAPLETKNLLSSALSLCVNLWVGLEASFLRAAKLEKHDYTLIDVVAAGNMRAAEARFFARALAAVPHAASVSSTHGAGAHTAGVVGLFPATSLSSPVSSNVSFPR